MNICKLYACILFSVIYISCSEDNNLSPYYPSGLVEKAILYDLNEEDFFPGLECGIVPKENVIDSVLLNENEWSNLIMITSEDESSELFIIDCFQASFVVVFTSVNNNYISHVTVSLNCRKIKYANDERPHFITMVNRDQILTWYKNIMSKHSSNE